MVRLLCWFCSAEVAGGPVKGLGGDGLEVALHSDYGVGVAEHLLDVEQVEDVATFGRLGCVE